jgi:hypothetical protein
MKNGLEVAEDLSTELEAGELLIIIIKNISEMILKKRFT